MGLRGDMLALSKAVRPKILQLAREGRLVERCFREFQAKVYAGAPPEQIKELRVAFFAGAAELNTMLVYASDTETEDATDEDLALLSGINDEIEKFHRKTVADATGAH